VKSSRDFKIDIPKMLLLAFPNVSWFLYSEDFRSSPKPPSVPPTPAIETIPTKIKTLSSSALLENVTKKEPKKIVNTLINFLPSSNAYWDYKNEPKGWWLMEQFDGIRLLWNGTQFVSQYGQLIESPEAIRSKLPKNVVLDGELW
jgi:ATP-dependent DNA ligase